MLKSYESQQSSSIYTPSHHRIQVPKALGAREIYLCIVVALKKIFQPHRQHTFFLLSEIPLFNVALLKRKFQLMLHKQYQGSSSSNFSQEVLSTLLGLAVSDSKK